MSDIADTCEHDLLEEDDTDVVPTIEGRVFEGVGILSCATSILHSGLMEKLASEMIAAEKRLRSQGANVDSSESALGSSEGTKDTSAQFIEATSPVRDIGEHPERMDVDENSMKESDEYDDAFKPDTPLVDISIFDWSPSEIASLRKIPRSIDIMNTVFGVNPEDFNIPEISEKERGGLENILDKKASDLLAESEESYLSLSGTDVKRLDIEDPPYDLISKDYKPTVGFVGEEYQIVIDVSGFSRENIVVNAVSDMVNVYAKDNHVGKGCFGLHKVYKIPQAVNKELLRAHMLNPRKLCISAPVKQPV